VSLEVQLHRSLGAFTLDVTFQAPPGRVTALFGPSGAGKTSVLRGVAGLDRGALGRVRLGDAVWQDERVFLPPHRRRLGYVFQEASLFEHLDVAGNLDYGLRRRAGRRERRDELVALLDLSPLMGRRVHGLSGGERRRVALARALAPDPDLLLMDEPLAGLDKARRDEVLPAVERLARNLSIPVVLVSHDLDEVARLADRLVLMQAGHVRAAGALQRVLTDPDLALAQAPDSAAVLHGRVESPDERWGLARVRVGEHRLLLPDEGLVPGRAVRLRIASRDVSVARERPGASSVLNVLPVTVAGRRDRPPLSLLTLDLGAGESLLSRITRRSAETLALAEGDEVFALIKSVAVLP